MVDKLKEWATQRGYRVAWGSGSIVDIVKQEILQRKSESEIDKLFFNDELKSIVTVERQNQAQTVLLVAKPSSAFLVNFDVGRFPNPPVTGRGPSSRLEGLVA